MRKTLHLITRLMHTATPAKHRKITGMQGGHPTKNHQGQPLGLSLNSLIFFAQNRRKTINFSIYAVAA